MAIIELIAKQYTQYFALHFVNKSINNIYKNIILLNASLVVWKNDSIEVKKNILLLLLIILHLFSNLQICHFHTFLVVTRFELLKYIHDYSTTIKAQEAYHD